MQFAYMLHSAKLCNKNTRPYIYEFTRDEINFISSLCYVKRGNFAARYVIKYLNRVQEEENSNVYGERQHSLSTNCAVECERRTFDSLKLCKQFVWLRVRSLFVRNRLVILCAIRSRILCHLHTKLRFCNARKQMYNYLSSKYWYFEQLFNSE